jgi:hypothetical protein
MKIRFLYLLLGFFILSPGNLSGQYSIQVGDQQVQTNTIPILFGYRFGYTQSMYPFTEINA